MKTSKPSAEPTLVCQRLNKISQYFRHCNALFFSFLFELLDGWGKISDRLAMKSSP
ncbi:MAG TPA: hypothetical protein V6C90_09050 [Coleofasciculaceae cyanobacterium]